MYGVSLAEPAEIPEIVRHESSILVDAMTQDICVGAAEQRSVVVAGRVEVVAVRDADPSCDLPLDRHGQRERHLCRSAITPTSSLASQLRSRRLWTVTIFCSIVLSSTPSFARLDALEPGCEQAGQDSDLRRELDDRVLHDTAVELELMLADVRYRERSDQPHHLEQAPAPLAPVRDQPSI